MTTAVEIRKWTRAITSNRDDVVLRGRDLFVRPIRHVIRGVAFPGSWDKALPRPHWFVSITFTPPTGVFGGKWRGDLPIGRSTDRGFAEALNGLLHQAVDKELAPLDSLEAFFNAATTGERPALVLGAWERLQDFPDYHAPVLAALGRLEEAADVAAGFVDKQEPRWRAVRAEGERQIAGYRQRGIGRDAVDFADHQLSLLSDLKELANLSAEKNKAGVAALLHDWQQQKMKRWNLEGLWEQTPFPVEEMV